jgi:hypothetical protein
MLEKVNEQENIYKFIEGGGRDTGIVIGRWTAYQPYCQLSSVALVAIK